MKNKDVEKFINEKYGSNNWGVYPPSARMVSEWIQEYSNRRLALHGIVIED